MDFRVIQGSPAPVLIAPYIQIVTADAKATVNSIYRGDEAAAILHAHGKSTQREIYEAWKAGREPNPANPPGFSTHELRSDGVAFPHVPRGDRLPWHGQGFDVNDSDVDRVIAQAASHKWRLFRPYPAGSEFHHLCFRVQPRPTPHTIKRIYWLRRTLPRS